MSLVAAAKRIEEVAYLNFKSVLNVAGEKKTRSCYIICTYLLSRRNFHSQSAQSDCRQLTTNQPTDDQPTGCPDDRPTGQQVNQGVGSSWAQSGSSNGHAIHKQLCRSKICQQPVELFSCKKSFSAHHFNLCASICASTCAVCSNNKKGYTLTYIQIYTYRYDILSLLSFQI